MHMDKTGHIIIFFSNKPHCTTTMGTRVEKGQKSWIGIIIHIYSGRYLKLKREVRQVKQKFFDFKKGNVGMANMHKKQRRQDRDGFVMMAR